MYVKDVTGLGITSSVDMVGTDLGIHRYDRKRKCNILMFGDSFQYRYLKGRWDSPVVVAYDDEYDVLGVPGVDALGKQVVIPNHPVKQLWDYPHNNPVFSTVLPTDFININGVWMVHVMVTKGLANEVWTEFQVSRDLVNWTHSSYILPDPNSRPQTMLTFDRWGEWIYIYATAGLQRDKPVYLYRCLVNEFPLGYWQSWGWKLQTGWAWDNPASPILEGQYGEICLRNRNGQAMFSYFNNDPNGRRVAVRTAADPLSNWYDSPERIIAHERDYPQLYGGYQGDNRKDILVSQWNTSTNDPYKVMLFREALL